MLQALKVQQLSYANNVQVQITSSRDSHGYANVQGTATYPDWISEQLIYVS